MEKCGVHSWIDRFIRKASEKKNTFKTVAKYYHLFRNGLATRINKQRRNTPA